MQKVGGATIQRVALRRAGRLPPHTTTCRPLSSSSSFVDRNQQDDNIVKKTTPPPPPPPPAFLLQVSSQPQPPRTDPGTWSNNRRPFGGFLLLPHEEDKTVRWYRRLSTTTTPSLWSALAGGSLPERLGALEMASRQALLVSSNTTTTENNTTGSQQQQQQQGLALLQDLLQQWHVLLCELPAAAVSSVRIDTAGAVQQMYELYHTLLEQQQPHESSESVSSKPNHMFSSLIPNSSSNSQSLLQADSFAYMLHAYSYIEPNGPRALEILQAWQGQLGGDLEQAPTKHEYHAVLRAYAYHQSPSLTRQSTTTIHHRNDDTGRWPTNRREDEVVRMEGAQVAMEIVQHLHDGYHMDMRPDALTHALAMKCLGRAAPALQQQQQPINAAAVADLTAFWHTTCRALLEAWNSSMAAGDDSKTDSSTNHDSQQELFLTTLDALDVMLQHHHHHVASAGHQDASFDLGEWLAVWEFLARSAVQAAYNNNSTDTNVASTNVMMQLMDQTATTFLKRLVAMATAESHSNAATTSNKNGTMQQKKQQQQQQQQRAYYCCELINTTMRTLAHASNPCLVLPDGKHYFLAIKARTRWLGHCYNPKNDERVSYWLDRIETLDRDYCMTVPAAATTRENDDDDTVVVAADPDGEVVPSPRLPHKITRMYNYKMMAYYEAGRSSQVQKIWDEIVRSRNPHSKEHRFTIIPDMNIYSLILKTLAEQGTVEAAEKAHAIWMELVSLPSSNNQDDRITSNTKQQNDGGLTGVMVKPTAHHYCSVMAAWAKSGHPQARKKCIQIMDRLFQEQNEKYPELRPTAAHFNSWISCHRSPRDLESLLYSIDELMGVRWGVEMDFILYTTCLVALSRMESEIGARIALELLNSMEQASKRDDGKGKKRDDLRPSRVCYGAVMQAWSRSGSPQSAQECELLLKRLEAAFEKSGKDGSLRPDTNCYRNVIEAHLGSNQSRHPSHTSAGIHEAGKVLMRMETAASQGMADHPDAYIYSIVLTAFASSGLPDGPFKTESILQRMTRAHETGLIRQGPDGREWSALLYAYAKSDLPDKASRARKVLDHIIQTYRQAGDEKFKPAAASFASVLNACAYSNTSDLKVRKEVVHIALTTLNEMDEYSAMTSGSSSTARQENYGASAHENAYRQVFSAIARHVDDEKERERVSRVLFDRCCHQGLVSRKILGIIRKYVPSLYSKLQTGSNQELFIPYKWSHRLPK